MDPSLTELQEFVQSFLKGVAEEEQKYLKLAAWCAEKVTNEAASQPGTLAVLKERRGVAGARIRLYIDLIKAADGMARLFAMYTPGARHTVAHVRLNKKEVFVDPILGCVCRIEGTLKSFEEMHGNPEKAADGIELLTLNSDVAVIDDPSQDLRVGRIRRLYCANQLEMTRSFGFLHDENPHPFHMRFDLSRLWYFPRYHSKDPMKINFIESADQFGIAIPNFFGATDKRPSHHWEFENADLNDEYAIVYNLIGLRGKVTIEACSDSAEFQDSSRITIREGDGQDKKPVEWRLHFRPLEKNVSIKIESKFQKGSYCATIAELRLERVGGPLLDRDLPTYGVDDIILECNGNLPINTIRVVPPSDPDRIKKYLINGSFLSIMLRDKAFHPWPQRPYNFTWISDALAAIYAHRVTGDPFFLDWIINTFDQILSFRDCETGAVDDFRKRAMNSWGSYITLHMHGCRKGWVNEVCTAACMVMPVLVFCHDVKNNPVIGSKYRETAVRFLPICQAILEEYSAEIHYDEASDGAYLVMPHDGEPEPTAHAAPYAASLVALYACTGEDWHLDLAKKFANYFRASISVDDKGVWSWPYRPTPGHIKGPGALYFKARVSLIFPIVANSLGYLFSDEDMAKFAETFSTYVLTENGTIYTTISNHERTVVDGQVMLDYAYKYMSGSLRQIIGYYPLALFDPEVGERIERYVAQNEIIFDKDFMSMPLGVESYAIRLDHKKALKPDFVHQSLSR